MANKHANTIREEDLAALLDEVVSTADKPEVMRVAFMLSYYAGLRVQEIAGLEWDVHIMQNGEFHMTPSPVYGPDGKPEYVKRTGVVKMKMTPTLFIGSNIGKYGAERAIPMNTQLAAALKHLYAERDETTSFVIPSGRNGAGQGLKKRAHALKMRINRMYKAMGMEGYSSHSGRRSFITKGAQKANAYGTSLLDVQQMAGHRNLSTTQAYIDPSDRQADLVEHLYGA